MRIDDSKGDEKIPSAKLENRQIKVELMFFTLFAGLEAPLTSGIMPD